jgi:hypothetical protein
VIRNLPTSESQIHFGGIDMNQNNAINKIATQVYERKIVITRVFDAPRDLVFDAWTKEEHLSKW